MLGNRSRDTGLERSVRSELHRRGLRFRIHLPIEVGEGIVHPDLVFTRWRLCIFLDGCYWHNCPDHGSTPKANSAYWAAKFAMNVERDRRQTASLLHADWEVARYWEHEAISAVVDDIASRLATHMGLATTAPRAM